MSTTEQSRTPRRVRSTNALTYLTLDPTAQIRRTRLDRMEWARGERERMADRRWRHLTAALTAALAAQKIKRK